MLQPMPSYLLYSVLSDLIFYMTTVKLWQLSNVIFNPRFIYGSLDSCIQTLTSSFGCLDVFVTFLSYFPTAVILNSILLLPISNEPVSPIDCIF